MKIGPVRVEPPVTRGPLEEHANPLFRLLMKQFGAALVCTERIDSRDEFRDALHRVRDRTGFRRLVREVFR